MRYSKLFGKTIKDAPKDATLVSHKLLYQAGFIRESTAGRYYLLPLGLRVHEKIKHIIKSEMDSSGAQEMVAPVLHPKSLWQETNRTTSVGFELMTIRDRNDMEFVLGGTAEEMLVDVVRKFQLSRKDLPFHVYQFSTKFRDELRARGGLLRLREFVMKDGYSFDADEKSFKREYEKMRAVYKKIFDRLGLSTVVVESDNGYIGGEYCHEFVVESDAGESKFYVVEDGSYAAHEEVVKFTRGYPAGDTIRSIDEPLLPLQEVAAVRGTTMEAGVAFHNKPLWQQIKDVLFVDERGRFILAIIRGDYSVNETKLLHAVKAYTLRPATDEEIRKKLHSEPGFLSPVGLKEKVAGKALKGEDGSQVSGKQKSPLLIVADPSLRTIHNAYGGANTLHRDFININIDRDYIPDIEADIAMVREGFLSESGKPLIARRGIEVGNIFQLGFHYSSRMSGAEFTDADGQKKPYYMGCYGIGLARTMATIVEKFHDEKGIIWPREIAPYAVHLIGITNSRVHIRQKLEAVYKKLQEAGVEVLLDDRDDVSAGARFADADLIGIPVRLVISGKAGDKIEWKERANNEKELLTFAQLLHKLLK